MELQTISQVSRDYGISTRMFQTHPSIIDGRRKIKLYQCSTDFKNLKNRGETFE